MYCNKVKKGTYYIIYALQLNLTKLNMDQSFFVRRIFKSSVVKTLLCSGCFTACISTPLPRSETGIRRSDDSLWYGSKWGCQFD